MVGKISLLLLTGLRDLILVEKTLLIQTGRLALTSRSSRPSLIAVQTRQNFILTGFSWQRPGYNAEAEAGRRG